MEACFTRREHVVTGMQGQQAAKSGIDSAHGQAKAGIDQAAGTAASQVCVACQPLCTIISLSSPKCSKHQRDMCMQRAPVLMLAVSFCPGLCFGYENMPSAMS